MKVHANEVVDNRIFLIKDSFSFLGCLVSIIDDSKIRICIGFYTKYKLKLKLRETIFKNV